MSTDLGVHYTHITLLLLGDIAQTQKDYPQARSHFQQGLKMAEELGEPVLQAAVCHHLGALAEEQQEWSEAELYYREGLALQERINDSVGAAEICSQLAILASKTERADEAESWFRSALHRIEQVNRGGVRHAEFLANLAIFLINEVEAGQSIKTPLEEIREYAEQALRIAEQAHVTHHWQILGVLSRIAVIEGHEERARAYRRKQREVYMAFEGNRYKLEQSFGEVIPLIVSAALGSAQARGAVKALLSELEKYGNGLQLSEAVERLYQGERDWHILADYLTPNEALIILRVLEELASMPNSSTAKNMHDDYAK